MYYDRAGARIKSQILLCDMNQAIVRVIGKLHVYHQILWYNIKPVLELELDLDPVSQSFRILSV